MSAEAQSPVIARPLPNKQRIAETFGRAATTYDNAAVLQQRVAAHVRGLLPTLASDSSVLDMGCGTGRETLALKQHYGNAAYVTGLDLSNGMLAYARSQELADSCCWLAGDIEQLPFAARQFDLVFSSLAIQWCSSLPRVLSEVSRVLKPEGRFIFSTLAAGSLHELHRAWQQVDDNLHINHYDDFISQKQIMVDSNLSIVTLYEQEETVYYSTVVELLRDMKALGVNTVVGRERTGLFGRTTLARLQQGYEIFATKAGFPASYRVVYGELCKRR